MKIIFLIIVILTTPSLSHAQIKSKALLNVSLVQQGKSLCGPATIEMLFRYWGEYNQSQYSIAEAMLAQFSDSRRYIKSGIMDQHPRDWSKYPGTGTINIREYLKRHGSVRNIMFKNEPISKDLVDTHLAIIKQNISKGIPVIVHQYWSGANSSGHYRLVTGYNDHKKIIYLNDSDRGRRITQSYKEFLEKWNVDQKWLHYNAIIFKPKKTPLRVK